MLKILDKRYGGDGLEESNCLSISAMISLVVLMVAGIMYALYLFIHAMGISDIAGVHISKDLMLALKKAKGELYTNDAKGIKDWIIYKDDVSGLSIKYPNDLLVTKTVESELEFKKSGPSTASRRQSLAYAFLVGENEVPENSLAEDFMRNKYPEWTGELKTDFYGGKEGSRTGVFKSASGIYKDIVFWKVGNKTVYVESRYYSEKNGEYESIFDNIISEINFT
ncbi:MAG: hypothetical protein ACD_67C00018G0002 [uncultured bacterium]|nr:MAG: hypothetical protein ACD_67C00018G0002 [uncultured bacterium]